VIVRPCPNVVACPGTDEPISNYSSEASDLLDYISTFFAYGPDGPTPPLLQNWTATGCEKTYISTISQQDADFQAQSSAMLCANHGQLPGITLVFNQPQTCCVPCPDGTQFCYTVPGFLFSASNLATANGLAEALACHLAPQHKICLGSMPSECCMNQFFSATITATGPLVQGSGNNWFITDGVLPIGLQLTSNGGNTAILSGTPTVTGSYDFSITIMTSSGDTMTKNFQLCVVSIDPSSATLSAGQVGTVYTSTFSDTSGCAVAPLNFQVIGTLPPGLTLNQTTGVLTGTPTTAGTYTFSILLQDSST